MKSESSGHFKRLLVSLSNGMREEGEEVNPSLATADAAELIEAGIDTIGTDESTFNRYGNLVRYNFSLTAPSVTENSLYQMRNSVSHSLDTMYLILYLGFNNGSLQIR